MANQLRGFSISETEMREAYEVGGAEKGDNE